MITVCIYYKEPKTSCCGIVSENTTFEMGFNLEAMREEAIEVMENYENGAEDSYRIVFRKEEIVILEVIKQDGIWKRFENEKLIKENKDFTKIFD